MLGGIGLKKVYFFVTCVSTPEQAEFDCVEFAAQVNIPAKGRWRGEVMVGTGMIVRPGKQKRRGNNCMYRIYRRNNEHKSKLEK